MDRNPKRRKTELILVCGVFGLALSLSACVIVRPGPSPIDAVASAKQLTARSLQDPEITAALTRMGLSTDRGWTLDALTVAAWSLRSDTGSAPSLFPPSAAASTAIPLIAPPRSRCSSAGGSRSSTKRSSRSRLRFSAPGRSQFTKPSLRGREKMRRPWPMSSPPLSRAICS